ncbi:MAG: Rne/Rng family ribonuclease [bacterium]|nr:Rne/Rng family ribonuclease [bacterium]
MTKKIVISERDSIAAVMEDNKVSEFFITKGDVLLGDVYLSVVDNVLPSIEAAFVNVGMPDKMGFIHTDDIQGKGPLNEKVKPKQKLIVQVVKEPTGHKGPRVTTSLSLPGRFLVLLPDETGINVSRKIVSSKERARLKSIVSLLKPVGVGVIVRTEAENQSDAEIQEDMEMLLEKWNSIVTAADTSNPPCLLYRDQDLLYKVIREAASEDTDEIIVDTSFALHRTTQLLQHWNMKVKVSMHKGNDPLLVAEGIHKEIMNALQTKVNLPLGGYLFIQQTEALTVIDVNSGKFTSSGSQAETILKTNLQAADEIARQLKLRNIGGMVIVDFIDMTAREDKLKLLEYFELALEQDKAKPQIGQLSDLGLVELTRHRQGQSISEIFTKKCDKCQGQGFVIEDLKFLSSLQTGEQRAKINKIKGPFAAQNNNNNNQNGQKNNNFQKFNKNKNERKDFQKNKFQNNENRDNQNKQREQGELAPEVQEVMDRILNEGELIKQEPEIQNIRTEALKAEVKEQEEQIKTEAQAPSIETEAKEASAETENKKPARVSRKAKKSIKKEQLKENTVSETETKSETKEPASDDQTETKEEKPKKRTGRRTSRKTKAENEQE